MSAVSVIWKWNLGEAGLQEIEAPGHTTFVCVQPVWDDDGLRHGVYMWGIVPMGPRGDQPQYATVTRRVLALETGALNNMLSGRWKHLGTLQLHGGTYVLHYFVEEEG